MTRAGIVTVAGPPNVGKSSLLNRIVGQKLAIVSAKPQSTRDCIVGIHTADGAQLVLHDTPGLMEPAYELQRAMRVTALRALRDADVIVHVADATAGAPAPLHEVARLDAPLRAPVLVALNKADLLPAGARRVLERVPNATLVSARTGDGIPALLAQCSARLPEGPFLYPEDDVSTQTLRFLAAELVRETALEQLGDEVPYSVACEIEEFREGSSPIYVRAVLFVERESQKRILVGAGGRQIRSIGQTSRAKVEGLVGESVYLDLWVKVLPNWRKSAAALARFGYQRSDGSSE